MWLVSSIMAASAVLNLNRSTSSWTFLAVLWVILHKRLGLLRRSV